MKQRMAAACRQHDGTQRHAPEQVAYNHRSFLYSKGRAAVSQFFKFSNSQFLKACCNGMAEPLTDQQLLFAQAALSYTPKTGCTTCAGWSDETNGSGFSQRAGWVS